MTKVLAFPVSCTYDDNFMLDLDPIHLDAGITDIDGIHENGDFGQYFTMRAYKDDQYSSEIAADNTVHIGDRIWVKIGTTKNLPANIDYFLTDCTAYRDFTKKQNTDTFNMIENMCYADLIDIDNPFPVEGGVSFNGIFFDFHAFAFSNSPVQVSMQCTIKLCAMSVDGAKIESSCAVQPNTCPSGFSKN